MQNKSSLENDPADDDSVGEDSSNFSRERDEMARFMIENGDLRVFKAMVGGGEGAALYRAIMGESQDDYERNLRFLYPDEEPDPQLYRKKPKNIFDRSARHFTAAQCLELYSAVAFANASGILMNVSLSITWGLIGISDHNAAANALQYQFLKHLKGWRQPKKGRGAAVPWLYVHEVGDNHGFHTHLLLSVAPELMKDFKQWVKKRLTNISGFESLEKEAFHCRALSHDQIERQWFVLRYFLKGAHPNAKLVSKVGKVPYVRVLDLIHRGAQSPGRVACQKQCGTSVDLARTRRRKVGFRSLMEQGVLDRRRLYAGMEYLDWVRRTGAEIPSPLLAALLEREAQVVQVIDEELANKSQNQQVRRRKKAEALAIAKSLERDAKERRAILAALTKLVI
jgi:hypothetical protein